MGRTRKKQQKNREERIAREKFLAEHSDPNEIVRVRHKSKKVHRIFCPFDHSALLPHIVRSRTEQPYLLCPVCNKKFVYSNKNIESHQTDGVVFYNLSYYAGHIQKKVSPKTHIKLNQNSVLIYGNSFDCVVAGHKTERMRIDIPIKVDLEISPPTGINAAYCPKCHAYYILSNIYKMYEHSRIACHVQSKQQARRLLRKPIENNLNARSVLMEYGYSVSKTSKLPASERHRILREILDAGVLSEDDVTGYLRWFIEQHKSIPSNQEAVIKWKDDLEYVYRYVGVLSGS